MAGCVVPSGKCYEVGDVRGGHPAYHGARPCSCYFKTPSLVHLPRAGVLALLPAFAGPAKSCSPVDMLASNLFEASRS